jgi:hypothetical protein
MRPREEGAWSGALRWRWQALAAWISSFFFYVSEETNFTPQQIR